MKKVLILFSVILLLVCCTKAKDPIEYEELSMDELIAIAEDGDAEAQSLLGAKYALADWVDQDFSQ